MGMASLSVLASILINVLVCTNALQDSTISGGHSRDFVDVDEISAWQNVYAPFQEDLIQQSRMKRASVFSRYSDKEIADYVETFKPALEEAVRRYKSLVGNRAYLQARLKTVSSIKGKLERKTHYTLYNLTDIIGMRLTCQTKTETLAIRDVLKKDVGVFLTLEEECYGVCPGVPKYNEHGYRRVHMLQNIKQFNKTFEVQLGTPYMNKWADWDHDLIYKGPEDFKNHKDVTAYKMSMAEYFYQLDETRDNLPACPAKVSSSSALDILNKALGEKDGMKAYKKMGEPPSACYWWNVQPAMNPTTDTSSSSSPRMRIAILVHVLFAALMFMS